MTQTTNRLDYLVIHGKAHWMQDWTYEVHLLEEDKEYPIRGPHPECLVISKQAHPANAELMARLWNHPEWFNEDRVWVFLEDSEVRA